MRAFLLSSVLLLSGSSAWGQDYSGRLAREQAELEKALLAACPQAAEQLPLTRPGTDPRQRCKALQALSSCAAALEPYHLRTSSACFAVSDFTAAERSARAALAIRVTESGQLALLDALVRQEPRRPAQDADLQKHLDYFRKRTCTRDDLCAGLSYVAWHVEDHALTIKAARRAISLGFPGWQPYFFGGTALAGGSTADRAQAKAWLIEAKQRGGPAAIDGFLERL